MATPFTAWGLRIDELLADGEWHELEDVYSFAATVVPPGRAYRQGEFDRSRRAGAPATRQVGTRETAVTAGARRIVKKTVESRIRRGTVVRWGSRIRRAR